MSFLSQLLNESSAGGSTSAGSVAGSRGRLFGDPNANDDKQKTNMLRRIGYKIITTEAHTITAGKRSSTSRWKDILEADSTYDATDVISKLDAAEAKAKNDDDTVCFGMEDEDGTIVKVYVRSDQAEDFEQALATMLSGADEDADEDNSHGEIAEVLFNLKDKFEIVDVDWGQIEGDEEEEQEVAPDDAGASDASSLEGGEPVDGEGVDSAADVPPPEATPDASSMLQAVIDMMAKDTEAKKAEAEARKAEAETKIAAHAVTAAEAKAKQEEELLDMEQAEKAEKSTQKEAKQLAKLAAYRHKVRGNGDVPNNSESESASTGEEDEEEQLIDNSTEISMDELADRLFKHLAAN